MIALQSDCLIFQLTNGESVPCSAEMITVEIVGNSEGLLDPEMLRHAAASVFHYFKNELERETVTVGEFARALEKVLRGLGLTLYADESNRRSPERTSKPTSAMLARESADSLELVFFPAPARRIARPAPAIAARGAFSRTARLRQAACRRAPLERALRKNAGANRRISAPMPDRRAGAKRMRARGGITSGTDFSFSASGTVMRVARTPNLIRENSCLKNCHEQNPF